MNYNRSSYDGAVLSRLLTKSVDYLKSFKESSSFRRVTQFPASKTSHVATTKESRERGKGGIETSGSRSSKMYRYDDDSIVASSKKGVKKIPANAEHEKELKNASLHTALDELLEKAIGPKQYRSADQSIKFHEGRHASPKEIMDAAHSQAERFEEGSEDEEGSAPGGMKQAKKEWKKKNASLHAALDELLEKTSISRKKEHAAAAARNYETAASEPKKEYPAGMVQGAKTARKADYANYYEKRAESAGKKREDQSSNKPTRQGSIHGESFNAAPTSTHRKVERGWEKEPTDELAKPRTEHETKRKRTGFVNPSPEGTLSLTKKPRKDTTSYQHGSTADRPGKIVERKQIVHPYEGKLKNASLHATLDELLEKGRPRASERKDPNRRKAESSEEALVVPDSKHVQTMGNPGSTEADRYERTKVGAIENLKRLAESKHPMDRKAAEAGLKRHE
jgi:hypothetical protein